MTLSAPQRTRISIELNGTRREIPSDSSLADLLRELTLDPRMVVVEHNRTILRDRTTYSSLSLNEDDVLEIVQFVGGG